MTKTELKRCKSTMRSVILMITEAAKQIHLGNDELLAISTHTEFIHLFDDVKDFRQQWKIEYRLSDILLMVLIEVLRSKSTDFTDIADFIRADHRTLEECGLLKHGHYPSHDTIRRIMMYLNADSLTENVVYRLKDFLMDLESAAKNKEKKTYEPLAADGKENRGTGRAADTKNPSHNIALLNIYYSGLCLCVESIPIDQKTNEIPVVQEQFAQMDLKGTVITADALHCQKKTCRIIRKQKGHYVLTVRDNQPTLVTSIDELIEHHKENIVIIERENCNYELYRLPKGYACDGFTDMKTVVRMHSKKNKKKPCIRHFISSLSNPEVICDAIESRWNVEDDLHRGKDEYFDEDHIRYTNPQAVRNMGIIGNIAYCLMKVYRAICGIDTVAQTKPYFVIDPIACLDTMVTLMNSEEIIRQLKEQIGKNARRRSRL